MQGSPDLGTPLLDGLRVLEASGGYPGRLAGKLLCDLGADVTRVPLLAEGDTVGGRAHDIYLDAGKRIQTIPIPEFEESCRDAHVLLLDRRPDRLGLDLDSLRDACPHLLIEVITPFGLDWPYRDWRTGDAGLSAMGGTSSHNGQPDRHPLRPPAGQALFQGGLQGAVGALLGILGRPSSAVTDLSIAEAVATFDTGPEAWGAAISGEPTQRAGPRNRTLYPYGLFECNDGHVSVIAVQRAEWERFLEMVGNPEWAAIPRYQDRRLMSTDYPEEVDALLAPWFRARSKWEVFETARRHRVAAVPICSPGEALESPHLQARAFFRRTRAGDLAPAPPMLIDGKRPQPGRSQYRGAAGDSPGDLLSGLRVLDFGWVWAGAIPGQVLSDLGADVIKVESTSPLDSTRRGRPFIGSRPDPNQNLMFHAVNSGKRSLGIDLKSPNAHELILDLVSRCDVLIENMGPGAMGRLGLDAAALMAHNPCLIYLSIQGMGEGPWQDLPVYGPTITALSGMDSETRYDDNSVMGVQLALVDPTAGLYGALGVLAALRSRERTGRGVHLEVSMLEVGTAMMAPSLLDPESRDTDSTHTVRCRGRDEWLVVGPLDPEQCRTLADEIAADTQPVDERGIVTPGFIERLCAWASCRPAAAAASALQRRGVMAVPLLDAIGRLQHPFYALRGTHVSVPDPIFGRALLPASPWRRQFRCSPPRVAGPLLGEHNRAIALDLLGMTEDVYHLHVSSGLFQQDRGAATSNHRQRDGDSPDLDDGDRRPTHRTTARLDEADTSVESQFGPRRDGDPDPWTRRNEGL